MDKQGNYSSFHLIKCINKADYVILTIHFTKTGEE